MTFNWDTECIKYLTLLFRMEARVVHTRTTIINEQNWTKLISLANSIPNDNHFSVFSFKNINHGIKWCSVGRVLAYHEQSLAPSPAHIRCDSTHLSSQQGEMAQEDQALEAILSYIVSSRAAWTTWNPVPTNSEFRPELQITPWLSPHQRNSWSIQ